MNFKYGYNLISEHVDVGGQPIFYRLRSQAK